MSTTKTETMTAFPPSPLSDLETIVMDAGIFAEVLQHMVETANEIDPQVFYWIGMQVKDIADRIDCAYEALWSAKKGDAA